MVTTLRRPVLQAQQFAAALEEALGRAWQAGTPDARAVAALHASTARVDALVLQLELVELPAVRLN